MTETESATPVADDERAGFLRHGVAVGDGLQTSLFWLAAFWPSDWPTPVLRAKPGPDAGHDRITWSIAALTPDEFDACEDVLSQGATAPVERDQDSQSVYVRRLFGPVAIEVHAAKAGE